jgi:hypothetical protein
MGNRICEFDVRIVPEEVDQNRLMPLEDDKEN